MTNPQQAPPTVKADQHARTRGDGDASGSATLDLTRIRDLSVATLVLGYVRALAWPVLLAGALVVYQPPIGRIVTSLAAKLEAADKVSVGSLSVEVAARAREVGGEELASSIGELSSAAVQALLQLDVPEDGSSSVRVLAAETRSGGAPYVSLPDSVALAALSELEQKGFIKFTEPLDKYLAFLESPANGLRRRAIGRRLTLEMAQGQPSPASTRLMGQSYGLTTRGVQAVTTIVRVVAVQLSHSE